MSMTGYGSGQAALGGGRASVEIRALNHRYLDVRVRLSAELADQAALVEETLRPKLERGRIEVSARLEGAALGPPVLDRERARTAFEQLCALRDQLRPEEPVPLSLLACVPDLFQVPAGPPSDVVREAVRHATLQACEDLMAMREREGAALSRDLGELLSRMEEHIERIRERVPSTVESYRERLRDRISRLLQDMGAQLDSGRLEHEVALFADRCDVAEELARLASHGSQFRELLAQRDGAVGRRLDFLLQEMAREANTVGAKTQDVDTTRLVVELKADIGRMREQVQNVL
ncbi:MAG: YicC/YloC family endoribonuclease [Myxococcota bacterium]